MHKDSEGGVIGFSDANVIGYRTDPMYDRIAKRGKAQDKVFWSNLDDAIGEGLFGKRGYSAVKKHAGDNNPYMYTYDEMQEQATEVFWASIYFIPIGEVIQGVKMLSGSMGVLAWRKKLSISHLLGRLKK